MGAYITKLPSTPQMARYTAARSAYTDPTVNASPPAWWGSSLGGCGSCGMGAIDVSLGRFRVLPIVGAAVGYFSKRSLVYAALGFVAGVVVDDFLLSVRT